MLKCSVCGAEVKQDGEKLERSCEHSDAAVIAEMSATVYGESKVQ